MSLSTHEKPPVANGQAPVAELVIKDMQERASFGRKKYGTFLQPFNGRNSMIDAYQEVMDLIVYIRQALEEFTLYVDMVNAVVEFYEAGNEEGLRKKYEEYLEHGGIAHE